MEKHTMTNYEAIKRMSLDEMVSVFYVFAKPMYEAFGLSEEQKGNLRKEIKEMLEREIPVKKP